MSFVSLTTVKAVTLLVLVRHVKKAFQLLRVNVSKNARLTVELVNVMTSQELV